MSRSPEQEARERAMAHVSAVLTNLDGALERARRGNRELARTGGDENIERALGQAVVSLERARKRLLQDAYYGGDDLRLI